MVWEGESVNHDLAERLGSPAAADCWISNSRSASELGGKATRARNQHTRIHFFAPTVTSFHPARVSNVSTYEIRAKNTRNYHMIIVARNSELKLWLCTRDKGTSMVKRGVSLSRIQMQKTKAIPQ